MDLEDTNQYIADQTTEHSKKIEKNSGQSG